MELYSQDDFVSVQWSLPESSEVSGSVFFGLGLRDAEAKLDYIIEYYMFKIHNKLEISCLPMSKRLK